MFGEIQAEAAGLRCPTPILLRLHVLVMEFIGSFPDFLLDKNMQWTNTVDE